MALQRQEAAQRRLEEEHRAKLEAERRAFEQQQERLRLAGLERERQEREAAQKRAEEEQRRTDPARKAHEQERQAAIERERVEREAAHRQEAQRREAEERKAEAAEHQRKQLAAVPPIAPSTANTADLCKRDEERLARLRAGRERDEVIRFERELGCERLRAQVVRLRESVVPGGAEAADARETGRREVPRLSHSKRQSRSLRKNRQACASRQRTPNNGASRTKSGSPGCVQAARLRKSQSSFAIYRVSGCAPRCSA